jgi:PEP-CTERM motif
MMRMTQGWNRLRTAVFALGLFAWSTTGAKADAISNLLDYSTAGSINYTTGVTGANVISYVPVTNASIDPSSNLPLGSFQVAALPTGQTTTYNNTPFSITLAPASYNNIPLTDNNPVILTGTLNGQLTGSYQSSVNVTFNPVADGGAFKLAGAASTLNVLQNDQKLLVPASAGGTTTLEGVLKTSGSPNPQAPVPEPSTIALFLSTIGGLGLRKYVVARRRRSQA